MWKLRSEEEIPDDTYVWLYDSMFDEVVLIFSYCGVNVDPDYTHWMYDGESSEEPLPPDLS